MPEASTRSKSRTAQQGQRPWTVQYVDIAHMKASGVLGRDLSQDAPHDLAGARLGQAGRPVDDVGRRDGPNHLAHRRHQLLLQRRRRRVLRALRVGGLGFTI